MIIEFMNGDGIEMKDRLAIAEIIQEAFWQKLQWFFKKVSKADAMQLLEKAITYELGFYYKEDDQVLAAALLSEVGNPHLMFGPEIRKRIGFWRSFILKSTFAVTPKDQGTLCLQMIAVRPSARGKGIGKKMLFQLEAYARSKGYAEIVLDVIDNNQGALKLYEWDGFIVKKHMNTKVFTRNMGFDGIYVMNKKLD